MTQSPFRFEFKVDGPPVSYQARDRLRLQAWKDAVRAEAMRLWLVGQPPVTQPLQITVVYYHDVNAANVDNDNLLKPIQDALNGIIYVDDRQITDTRVRRTNISGRFEAKHMAPIVADGFSKGAEFVYVRVEDAPDHWEIL